MTRKAKKILKVCAAVTSILVITLAIHIYMVTRPKANEKTIVLARVDITSDINEAEASKITDWLYRQKGVDHVFCNPESNIAVFTYYPLTADANQIADRLSKTFGYTAKRYLPSEQEMAAGCPAFAKSWSSRIALIVKNVL